MREDEHGLVVGSFAAGGEVGVGFAADDEVGGEDAGAGDDPCDWVDAHEEGEGASDAGEEPHPQETEEAGAEDGDDGGGHGVAEGSHGAAADFVAAGDELPQEHHCEPGVGEGHNGGVGCEDADEEAFLPYDYAVEDTAGAYGQQHVEAEYAVAAFEIAGGVVLGGEGDGGLHEGYDEVVGVELVCEGCG